MTNHVSVDETFMEPSVSGISCFTLCICCLEPESPSNLVSNQSYSFLPQAASPRVALTKISVLVSQTIWTRMQNDIFVGSFLISAACFTILLSLDRYMYSYSNLTRFQTHWCNFLAAAQPKSAVTQITTVVIILILGCSELEIKFHYATYRVLVETAEWHHISGCFYPKYLPPTGLDRYLFDIKY